MSPRRLEDVLTRQSLEELADERSFARGLAYFQEGAVEHLQRRKHRLSASVLGTHLYSVELWSGQRSVRWRCSCPVGEDGEFCKHAVAAGLAWLAGRANAGAASSELDAIEAFVKAADKQTLASLLLKRAEEDDELAARLLAAAKRSSPLDPATLRKTIRAAFAANGFVDYRHMPALVRRAALVPDLLGSMLKRGDAKTAAALAADAIRRGLAVLLEADDSDGGMSVILQQLVELHRKAARKGGLTQEALASSLFELQLADGFGFLTLEDYLPDLGKEGLAVYRRLAERAWKKVPALAPGEKQAQADKHRHELAGIMTSLARADGDADALVEVLRRDLTHPYTFFEIVQLLAKAGRHDEALSWAEQGRKAFPKGPNVPLDDFLVAEYHRRGRHEDAFALLWQRFAEQPSLSCYQKLKTSANKAKAWKVWREKAIARLLEDEAQRKKTAYNAWDGWHYETSVLIEVHLWEGAPRAALEQARAAGCPAGLWLQIAKALEGQSPADAIAIYQEQVEPIVRMANNDAYDRAVDLVGRVGKLLARSGRAKEFAGYVEELGARHKAKRNFVKRLKGLSPGLQA